MLEEDEISTIYQSGKERDTRYVDTQAKREMAINLNSLMATG